MSVVYDRAFGLLRQGDVANVEKGLAMLEAEVIARPEDSKALFEYAGGFDFLGREAEACIHYGRLAQAGVGNLPPEDQPRFFVQFGSTLKNCGRLPESRALLRAGLERFPDFTALRAFLALTEHADGQHRAAMRELFAVLLAEPMEGSLRTYSRALRGYASKL
jgi:thioredoxin-like negative regulator of GroEL